MNNPFRKSAEMPKEDVTVLHRYEMDDNTLIARNTVTVVCAAALLVLGIVSVCNYESYSVERLRATNVQAEANKAMFESMSRAPRP